MRTTPILFVLSVLALSLPVIARAATGEIEEERLAEIVTKREVIIARNLAMTPAQHDAFWPLYRKYRAERDDVDNRATKLAADFEKNFDNITDDLARKYTTGMMELQRTDWAIKNKYLRSFEKVLTPTRAAKFYQIESKLDAVLNYYRAERVPLMR